MTNSSLLLNSSSDTCFSSPKAGCFSQWSANITQGMSNPTPSHTPLDSNWAYCQDFQIGGWGRDRVFCVLVGPDSYELTYCRPEAGGGVEGGLGLLLRCSPAQARQGPRKHPNSWHPETFGIYFQIRYSFGLMAQQKPTQFTTPNRVLPGGGQSSQPEPAKRTLPLNFFFFIFSCPATTPAKQNTGSTKRN